VVTYRHDWAVYDQLNQCTVMSIVRNSPDTVYVATFLSLLLLLLSLSLFRLPAVSFYTVILDSGQVVHTHVAPLVRSVTDQLNMETVLRGDNHRGSTGPAEHLVRTTELPIWPPLSACVRNFSPFWAGTLSVATWYDAAWIGGTASGWIFIQICGDDVLGRERSHVSRT